MKSYLTAGYSEFWDTDLGYDIRDTDNHRKAEFGEPWAGMWDCQPRDGGHRVRSLTDPLAPPYDVCPDCGAVLDAPTDDPILPLDPSGDTGIGFDDLIGGEVHP